METVTNGYCMTCQKSYEILDSSPRCHSCGHTFCSTCISSLTTTKINCPECRATINLLSAEDIDSLKVSIHKSFSISSLDTSPIQGITTEATLTGITLETSDVNTGRNTGLFNEKETMNNPEVVVQSYESSLDCDYKYETVASSKNSSKNTLGIGGMSNTENARTSKESQKLSNSHENLVSDVADRQMKLPMELTLEEYIRQNTLIKDTDSEDTQQLLDVTNTDRKDSVLVHHSNSCYFDSSVEDKHPHKAIQDSDLKPVRENELQKFTDQIQILNEVLETVDDAILTLKVEEKHHESSRVDLLKRVKEEDEKIELLRVKIKEAEKKKLSVQQLTENLKEGEEEIAKASSVDDLKNLIGRSSEAMNLAEDVGTQAELYYMQYLLSRNIHKPEYVERMIDLGIEVFAEHLVGHERRWARVSLSDGLIHLHALKARAPPAHSRILPWSCLREMLSKESAASFLDIYIAGKMEGRVYLSMHGNNARAMQFLLLSSGEHRHCYRKVKMKQLGNEDLPGEYISFHGPKNANGSPIRGVVSGITQGGLYTRRKTAGLLAGAALSLRQRTLFVVYLSSDPDEDTTGAFGEVTRGIEILKDVSRHRPVEDVEIGDCGLIIPLPSCIN